MIVCDLIDIVINLVYALGICDVIALCYHK